MKSLPEKIAKAGEYGFKISRDILLGDIKLPLPIVKHAIDNYQFQLLDWRRQLGTAHLIYRNAHHTRLEHSFGVFELSRRLSSVLRSNDRTTCYSVTKKNGYLETDGPLKGGVPSEQEFKTLHIASLLHDIGNYPFCHQLERSLILNLPNHEQVGSMILRGAFTQIDFLSNEDLTALELGDKREALADIINTKSKEASLSNTDLLFKEIISGPYGVDFLDYIYRDSFYCGFSTRTAVDFLSDHTVLFFDQEKQTYDYGFTQHVLHELISLAYLRLDMERKVYSNKTHKIVSEMLARAIRVAIDEARLNVNELCLFTDDGLLSALEHRDSPQESRSLVRLIKSRRLFEVVYRLDALRPDVNPTVRHALRMWNLQQINELRERIYEELGDKSIDQEDVLVSFPHPEERICKEGDIFVLLESGEVKRLGDLDPWISYYESEYMNLRKYLMLLSGEVFPQVGDRVRNLLVNNFERWVLEIHGIQKFTVQSLEDKLQSLTDVERSILSLLLKTGLTAEELAAKFEKSRSTMVYHLTKLSNSGLIRKDRRGKEVIFNLLAEHAQYIQKALSATS